MMTVVKREGMDDAGGYRVYVKGASEIVLSR
jgi:magnesium-transporting ATPase (P-type)